MRTQQWSLFLFLLQTEYIVINICGFSVTLFNTGKKTTYNDYMT